MTKLERECPRIAELARQLGGEIRYDRGDYWLYPQWKQLTFLRNRHERATLAVKLLEEIIEARSKQGSRLERALRMILGLREAMPQFRPGQSMEVRERTLDEASIWRPLGRWVAELHLVGEEIIQGRALGAEAAIDNLEAAARRAYGLRVVAGGARDDAGEVSNG